VSTDPVKVNPGDSFRQFSLILFLFFRLGSAIYVVFNIRLWLLNRFDWRS
jgi:hypothetical protein